MAPLQDCDDDFYDFAAEAVPLVIDDTPQDGSHGFVDFAAEAEPLTLEGRDVCDAPNLRALQEEVLHHDELEANDEISEHDWLSDCSNGNRTGRGREVGGRARCCTLH